MWLDPVADSQSSSYLIWCISCMGHGYSLPNSFFAWLAEYHILDFTPGSIVAFSQIPVLVSPNSKHWPVASQGMYKRQPIASFTHRCFLSLSFSFTSLLFNNKKIQSLKNASCSKNKDYLNYFQFFTSWELSCYKHLQIWSISFNFSMVNSQEQKC